MEQSKFSNPYCSGEVKRVGASDLKVSGRINETVKNNKIYYVAASPADHRASYTGSGLPFANQLQAFDNTPNQGVVSLGTTTAFEINIMVPNSYQVGLGSVIVPPTLYIEYINEQGEDRIISVKVSDGIPYRTLTYPVYPRARKDVSFYDSQFYLQVRGQERILREAGYPQVNYMPENHWGTKPPM